MRLENPGYFKNIKNTGTQFNLYTFMHNIQWVIQKNLTSEDVIDRIEQACREVGVDCHAVNVIPFSEQLPAFPAGKRSIFYGSTTTMYLVYQDEKYREGVFFDEKNYTMAHYLEKWREHMLNFGARVFSIKEVRNLNYEKDKLFFVRPDADSKSFSGAVKRFGEIDAWIEQIRASEDMAITEDTQIILAEPYHITTEWRLWIVNGKVVTASQYRENFKLKTAPGCPQMVIDFAERRCADYALNDVFVMDIGLCGDQLYIIECGCMNSAGFYQADITAIIRSVTEYFYQKK